LFTTFVSIHDNYEIHLANQLILLFSLFVIIRVRFFIFFLIKLITNLSFLIFSFTNFIKNYESLIYFCYRYRYCSISFYNYENSFLILILQTKNYDEPIDFQDIVRMTFLKIIIIL